MGFWGSGSSRWGKEKSHFPDFVAVASRIESIDRDAGRLSDVPETTSNPSQMESAARHWSARCISSAVWEVAFF
jgi:hypothetical protein